MSEMVARMRDNPNHTSKRIVNAAKKHIHANNKYKDDMTCVLIILYNYGRFVADKSGPTDTEFFESVAPVMDDPIDRVAAAIEHCEQLIDAGCHPDDAPDSISGLNEEERYMVENFLHKHRGAAEPRSPPPASVSPTTSPGGGISPKSQDS